MKVAASVKAAADSIGLPIELRPMPSGQYSPVYWDPKAREGIDMMLWNGTYDLPAEPAARYQFYKTDAVFNLAGIDDTCFDDLANRAISTIDDAKRAELVAELQRYMIDNGLIIPIVSPFNRAWVTDETTGVPLGSTQFYSAWANRIGTAE